MINLRFNILFLLLTACSLKNSAELSVSKIITPEKISFSSISNALESKTAPVFIDQINWKEYDYKPEVSFRMGYAEQILYLKFYVYEKHILAKHSSPNSPTHRDSCIEFFIDPDQSGAYYNFEFNCIGTTHLAYGPNRQQRSFIPPQLILENLFISSSLGNEPFEEKSGDFQWEMVVAIPAQLFIHHPDLRFEKLVSKANFYKCADATKQPHYISWNTVKSPKPDFHRPEFFGTLVFD